MAANVGCLRRAANEWECMPAGTKTEWRIHKREGGLVRNHNTAACIMREVLSPGRYYVAFLLAALNLVFATRVHRLGVLVELHGLFSMLGGRVKSYICWKTRLGGD